MIGSTLGSCNEVLYVPGSNSRLDGLNLRNVRLIKLRFLSLLATTGTGSRLAESSVIL